MTMETGEPCIESRRMLLTVERLLAVLVRGSPLEALEIISHQTELANAEHDLLMRIEQDLLNAEADTVPVVHAA